MRLEKWLPLYSRICDEFGFSQQEDLESARRLARIIGDRGLGDLERVRMGFPERVTVCGGGPNLADELSALTIEGYVVAADSATTVLVDSGIVPDMIVTDLDGIVEDQVDMNLRGATVFVHAHGDNWSAIEHHMGKFAGPIVGTCQCPPPPGIFNFGGFTDGDRAACISAELGAKRVLLAGFDFVNPSEKNGKSKAVKKRKLEWARAILDELSKEGVRVMSALDAES
ncbi:MAG: 6-hydroxymethylpterin diphosphokinase MptE-like protein [Thermoplasmata archaeon]